MENGKGILFSLISPEKTVYEGRIQSLTAKNNTGVFDILPQHENFISIIFGEIKVQEEKGAWVTLTLDRGVLMVSEDVVKVYTGLRR